MQQQHHHKVVPFLVILLLLVLAQSSGSSQAFEWQRPHQLDLKPGAAEEDDTVVREQGVVEIRDSVVPKQQDSGLGLPDEVVLAWNEQVLELDELTRCIRGSETGNAIERWLDCLASLEEEAPAPAASFVLKPSQTPATTQQSPISADAVSSSDAGVNAFAFLPLADDDSMAAFDPLSSVGHARARNSASNGVDGGLGSAAEDTSVELDQERVLDDEGQNLNLKAAAAVASEDDDGSGAQGDGSGAQDDGSGAQLPASSSGVGDEVEGGVRPGASAGTSFAAGKSSEDNRLPGEGEIRGAPDDVRRLSSKWGADVSAGGGAASFESSGCDDEDGGCLEVPTAAPSSTNRSQNLLNALKLAACLGAAITLLWRKTKTGRFWPRETEKQSVLSEGAPDYPCPSVTGFSVTGRSSSNSDVCYASVKAGSLPAPLGMAIATVMAEALQREHGERASQTADELSKLLEAAMTESLSTVMGSECPGFVEQFKQSFRSTYRLLGSVRNVSGRNAATPQSFLTRSGGFSRRRPEGPPMRSYERTDDDEEDDSSGLTSSQRRVDPDSESGLAEQLSRLTFSVDGPGTVAPSRLRGSAALRAASSGGRDARHVDDEEAFEDLDDVSSPLMPSEKGWGDDGSRVQQSGLRSRWGRGGLKQLADVEGAEDVISLPATEHVSRRRESTYAEDGDVDFALEAFGRTAAESSVSHYGGETHYKQQKMVLMEREMHLRKMELAYKFRDLNLKEASLHLSSESNSLMRENVGLGRSKASFREVEFQDRKLTAAHAVLAKRCADEMVAGLCVMLCALFFGAWKYSYERLVDVVSVCQPTLFEPSNSYVPGFNKVVNSMNHMISQLHMFACEVTVASRMFVGLGIISVVAASLLRKSVTSNSQAMPATILVVVLGGICGFAGKLAVDSMGGSGYHWLVLWETFCLVHTLAACFTATMYRVLNGVPPSVVTGKSHRQPYLMRPWWRRFWFHLITVLVLPILVGLLPFAAVREIMSLALSPVESYMRNDLDFWIV